MKQLTILIILIIATACSPVRNASNKKSASNQTAKNEKAQKFEAEIKAKSESGVYKRFEDTTHIYLYENENIPSKTKTKNKYSELSKAFIDFDNGKMSACDVIEDFAEDLPDNDSLRCETLYYLSECSISKKEFGKSISVLTDLIKKSDMPKSIHERALLRLGQVQCISGNSSNAAKTFDKFKKEFPKSEYLKLADCETIKKMSGSK